MPEWAKVSAWCVALMIGASAPTLIIFGLNPPTPSGANSQCEHQANAAQHHYDGQANQNSAQNPPPDKQPVSQDAVAAQPKEDGQWYAAPDWWTAGFTGALFTATAGLWIFTALMWRSTRQAVRDNIRAIKAAEAAATAATLQATHMENSVVAAQKTADAAFAALGSERAWVLCDGIHTSTFGNAHMGAVYIKDGIMVHMNWKNVGRSPAINTIMNRQARVIGIDDPLPKFDVVWPTSDEGTIVGPNLPFFTDDFPVGDSDLHLFKQRKTKIIYYSAVRYRDIYNSGVQHVSEACAQIIYNGVKIEHGQEAINYEIRLIGNQNTAI